MAYVSVARLKEALGRLEEVHPFFGVTFLSMKKDEVPVADEEADHNQTTTAEWGSAEENTFLDEYFRPPGERPNYPYCIPFGGRGGKHGKFWRKHDVSGSSLQSSRTRSEPYSSALHHPTPKEWAFKSNYVDILKQGLDENTKIPVLDVSAWLYRNEDLPRNLDDVVGRFIEEFGITEDELEKLFDDNTDESLSNFFFAEPISEEEIIQLVEGMPKGPQLSGRSEKDIVDEIEKHIKEEARFELPEGFVRNFYFALKAQRFAVLAGRPGTGKSTFARAYYEALSAVFPESVTFVEITVSENFGEADVVGYEKIGGGFAPRELSKELFIKERPRDIFVVLLDEMNLGNADYYLSSLLPGIESDAEVNLPGIDENYLLPPDAFFIGTANSHLEERTRKPLSGPVKRRSVIVEMPNQLERIIEQEDRDDFKSLLRDLLIQSKRRYERRRDNQLASTFESFRIEAFEEVLTDDQSPIFADEFAETLWGVADRCSDDKQTSLTIGVVQDILDYVAMSDWESVYVALDFQIAQKLVPQLTGDANVARKLKEFLREEARKGKGPEDFTFGRSLKALDLLTANEDPAYGMTQFPY